MVEIITIKCEWHGGMSVHDGQMKGSVQWFRAPGLIICKLGSSAKFHDRFCNLAVNEAIARHIPAMSLKRIAK